MRFAALIVGLGFVGCGRTPVPPEPTMSIHFDVCLPGGSVGDAAAFDLSHLADAGADIEPPRRCDSSTVVVVHGRGRRHLATHDRPHCTTFGTDIDDCPEIDPTAFSNDYELRLRHLGRPFRTSMNCGDAGAVVGGPLVARWEEVEWAVRALADDFARWDLDTTLTVFVGDESLCGRERRQVFVE